MHMSEQAAHGPNEAIEVDRGSCVVVLDDDDVMGTLMEAIFTKMGLVVHRFTSGSDALAALADIGRTYALLVTDLSMPVMSGYEVCAAAATLRPGLPSIVVSGDFHHRGVLEAAHVGIAALVAKRHAWATLNRLVVVRSEPSAT